MEQPDPNVPLVHAGVVLAYPCPACHGWAKPAFEERCGHYVCVLCRVHVDPACVQLCYQLTRSHMPHDLRYEQQLPHHPD